MAPVVTRRLPADVLSDDAVGITVGIDLGQMQDHTAIVVAEWQLRQPGADRAAEEHILIRHVERERHGTDYTAVARRLAEVDEKLEELIRKTNLYRERAFPPTRMVPLISSPEHYLDAGGPGGAFRDFLRSTFPQICVKGVTITAGAAEKEVLDPQGARALRIGKIALVARLQVLLGTRRIHLPDSPLMEQLVNELRVFQSHVSARTGNVSFEAAPGHHDDLVMAVALAVWRKPNGLRRGGLSYYV